MMSTYTALACAWILAGSPQGRIGGAGTKGDPFTFEVGVEIWYAGLEGCASKDKRHYQPDLFIPWEGEYVTDAEGTKISFGDDAGLEGAAAFPVFSIAFGQEIEGRKTRGDLLGPEWMAKLSFWTHTWSGSAVQDDTEILNGTVFRQGTSVESEITINNVNAEVLFKWFDLPRREFTVGLKAGLQIFYASLDMESPNESESVGFGVLSIGGGFWAEWHPVSFAYIAGGMAGYAGIPFIGDGSVQAGLMLGPVQVEAGYHFMAIMFKDDDQTIHATLGGPFLSVAIRF